MSDHLETPADTERLTMIGLPTRLALIGVACALALLSGCAGSGKDEAAEVSTQFSPDALTPAQFIDRFEQIDGVHSGFRRQHAKGIGVSGFFESNANGARLSKATVFEKGRVPVIGRFSLVGGEPYQPDRPDSRRGLGQFSLPKDEVWRTAMISFPLFPVSTPEIFYEHMLAFKPDAATGKPDPAIVKAFEERHPETVEALKKIIAEPQSSGFGNTNLSRPEYVSVHECGGQGDAGALGPETDAAIRGGWRRSSGQEILVP